VKNEMKAVIRGGDFQSQYEEITVVNPGSNRDFKMLDKDEIQYMGKMYDVISSRTSGNSIIFKCINDTREEQLLSRYDRYSSWSAGMNLPERSRNSQALLYHIIKHALLNKASFKPPKTTSVVLFFEPSHNINSVALLPDFPPPRLS